MKARVFKKEDGSICYSIPSSRYQEQQNFDNCKFPEYTRGLSYVDMDLSEVPLIDPEAGIFHEMLFFDGDIKKENLKIDEFWDSCIMPDFVIKQKYLSRLKNDLDKYTYEDFNFKSILNILKDIENCKDTKASNKNDNIFWVEKALEGLDNKVAIGEPDKPKIRKKIKDKIKELKKLSVS